MNKVRYLGAYMNLFDYLFWIDDDAFFLGLDSPLDFLMPEPGSFLSICASPVVEGLHTVVSSGQFMLRCDERGKGFLEAVENTDLDAVRAWWTDDLGYFTDGDQDAMVYLLKTDARFAVFDRHPFHAFNSRAEQVLAGDDVFLVHFTGRPRRKAGKLRDVSRYLGRGPTLLPAAEAARWHLQSPFLTRAIRWLRRRMTGA